MRLLLVWFCFAASGSFAQSWSQLSDFPSTQRDDGVGTNVGTKIYFGTGNRTGFGISNDFYSYDVIANTWTTLASMPGGSERQYAVCFANSTHLFVYGGLGNGSTVFNDIYRYDISANTWSLMGTRPTSVGVLGACSFTLGNKGYVFCGRWGSDAQLSSEVWEYDMGSNTWTQKNNFPALPTWRGCAATLNGTAYVAMGRNAADGIHREMYRYNASADSWTKVGDFPNAKRYYVRMEAASNRLVMVGGIDTLNVPFAETWFFDETNGFTQGPSIPAVARKGGMSAAYQNKVFYTCGWTTTGHTKQTWKLDMPVGVGEWIRDKGQWTMGPNPFDDEIMIEGNEKGKIVVSDVSGKIVAEESFEEKTILNLSRLEKGIYFVKIVSGNDVVVKRAVKG